jgi:hypothetical protein
MLGWAKGAVELMLALLTKLSQVGALEPQTKSPWTLQPQFISRASGRLAPM